MEKRRGFWPIAVLATAFAAYGSSNWALDAIAGWSDGAWSIARHFAQWVISIGGPFGVLVLTVGWFRRLSPADRQASEEEVAKLVSFLRRWALAVRRQILARPVMAAASSLLCVASAIVVSQVWLPPDAINGRIVGERVSPLDRAVIVSYNRMIGGAPYWGRATWGSQEFRADSNTLTQVGVTWSNTGLPPGYTLAIVVTRVAICHALADESVSDPCIGRIAEGFAPVVNQGESTVDLGDVPVTPGETYHVVYYEPDFAAGHWDRYWWECSCPRGRNSAATVGNQSQVIVRGYNR